ncbi:efflux RND transporter periplasmic adaptor subunit [Parasediminibacterium sp. JCM 36343]|uniref:efflux RND transporter periplasmic adaptor subunit n=1 Tax=Parasediminibacterium sp. JCM 36343 TaxID=3374279 RepID=UPI003979D7E1
MNKTLIWIIVGVVLVTSVLFGLKKAGIIGKEEGVLVATEKAQVRTITETVNASGKVYPEVEVKISPDISGEVTDLYVSEGDTVKKGKVLAKIYADIYATQRDQVAAGLTQAQAQLGNSAASIVGLKATLDQAKANYDRQQRLLKDKVIAQSEFETAQQTYLAAQANYLAAQEGLKSGQANILGNKAQLAKADKDISRTIITAPMDGVISLLAIEKGERVAGNSFNVGTEMMRIADLGSIEVRVDVGENDIPKVKIGDSALIEVDAYTGRKFKGLVYKIANPTTSLTSSTTDVTEYKVHIRLLLDSYKDLIIPGKSFPFRPNMSASADIQTKTKVGVLSVPLNAVTTRSNKPEKTKADKKDDNSEATTDAKKSVTADEGFDEVVFVLQKDGTVKKVKVKTGIQDINKIEIIEGLQKGDEVIVAPYTLISKTIKTGDKVKVVPKEKLYEDDKKKD